MENDLWLLILRNHSQCTTSTSLMKKIFNGQEDPENPV